MKKQTIENRFKILTHLTIQLGVMEKQMDALALLIDNGHHEAEEAMTHFENEIIRILDLANEEV